jgi:acetoin:2,6-dichlorophenolindophenol oxidoreductase subunit beta
MKEITYARALWEAFDEAMARDERVMLLGEDIGVHGNIFGAMFGLQEKYGRKRVRSSPISEVAIIGAGIGAATLGMRPVVEIMFVDFAMIAMDQIVNQAAKLRYMTGGKVKIPLVIRTQGGAGTGEAAQHSQSLESMYAHVPGLKVVMPSTPHDAKGLLLQAIEDDNPVMFIEHKLLYATRGPVQEGYFTIPFGKAEVRRQGSDITLVTYSRMVTDCLQAAEELSRRGVQAEVIDLRTLNPLDIDCILASVKRTGKLVVVHEACKTMGFGAEIMAQVAEQGISAQMRRVAAEDSPIPYSRVLEERVIPNSRRIIDAVVRLHD